MLDDRRYNHSKPLPCWGANGVCQCRPYLRLQRWCMSSAESDMLPRRGAAAGKHLDLFYTISTRSPISDPHLTILHFWVQDLQFSKVHGLHIKYLSPPVRPADPSPHCLLATGSALKAHATTILRAESFVVITDGCMQVLRACWESHLQHFVHRQFCSLLGMPGCSCHTGIQDHSQAVCFHAEYPHLHWCQRATGHLPLLLQCQDHIRAPQAWPWLWQKLAVALVIDSDNFGLYYFQQRREHEYPANAVRQVSHSVMTHELPWLFFKKSFF